MTSNELREKFLTFFETKGHQRVPSSSLVPQGDSSVLFTTAGMQQFKPYYTGEKDAMADFGNVNVCSVQKCVRTSDIDEVGDDTHLTFFEMLGNFSFGGYWKAEAISYAHEFITKELGLKIDYVSVFKDDTSGIPADDESRKIWQSIDANLMIKDHGKEDNFWGPTGDEGPCGPTTEIYVNGVEVWNIVFNEYYKTKEGEFKELETKGIDTGMGLERLLVMVQNKKSVYETDLFDKVIEFINSESLYYDERTARIVADHVKASMFLIADGVAPSNTGQGYILRRLLRRSSLITQKKLGMTENRLQVIFAHTAEVYKKVYGDLYTQNIQSSISAEEVKFTKTLDHGLKEFEKGTDPFILATTYGFPIELTEELAKEKGIEIDRAEFDKKMKDHQELSKTSSGGMFKGGLANHNEQTIKLHTAHHLLLAALQEIVSRDIHQRGSNITEERLRMDFSFDRKVTAEELKQVEDLVNQWIGEKLPVVRREMPLAQAEQLGAEMEFGAKYPDMVSVYTIQKTDDEYISKEFCGGPHVINTGDIGKFIIKKEEASSAGVRRIKAVVE